MRGSFCAAERGRAAPFLDFLDRHDAAQACVPPFSDFSHASRSDECEDFVWIKFADKISSQPLLKLRELHGHRGNVGKSDLDLRRRKRDVSDIECDGRFVSELFPSLESLLIGFRPGQSD